MQLYSDAPSRVRYAETDQMKVAYYANYLVWFEVGRAAFCRKCGFSYRDLEAETRLYLMVAESHCRHHRPLRYDEQFMVRCWLSALGRRLMTFSYRLIDPEAKLLYAEGWTKHVVADGDGKPRPLPENYLSLMRPYLSTRPPGDS